MAKNIVWLASYPKSGNTWLRLFLFNYLFDLDQPAPINQAHRIGPSDASVALYRKAANSHSINLHDPNVSFGLRKKVLASHASNGADVNFVKTHNTNAKFDGRFLIPAEVTRSAIYVLRDPMDMACSYAHHFAMTNEAVVNQIAQPLAYTEPDDTVVHQCLGHWSEHVQSWVHAQMFPTCLIRFEDMINHPEMTFRKVLEFLGAPFDAKRLEKAIRFSSFNESKKQEKQHGFIEKGRQSKEFFRAGKVGEGWKNLSEDLRKKVIADHGDVMREFGYLD